MGLSFVRMRKRVHLDVRLERAAPYLIQSGEEALSFAGGRPLHLEIGCGKGKFITETAAKAPDVPHLGVEVYDNVGILAAERASAMALSNVRFFLRDIRLLDEDLPARCIERIYLNFSDPWPKKKQAKRRLTHPDFLKMYARLLTSDGVLFFKTDNAKLFEFSLNSLAFCGFHLSNITFDLHKSDFSGNITTEYEERFTALGKPIFRLEARP